MTNILDRVEQSARKYVGHFRPSTTEEFFALRLAAKLGEASAARHYVDLAATYSQSQLISAYGRAVHASGPARRFHELLQSIHPRGGWSTSGGMLAGVRIERRAVGVALLRGDHLVYADARQLSVASHKAMSTAAGFVARLLAKLPCRTVILESPTGTLNAQKYQIQKAVLEVLGSEAAILEMPVSGVLAAYGEPPIRFRRDVRATISEIYPSLRELPGLPWTLDAAALGLYAHTEHLFNSINETLL